MRTTLPTRRRTQIWQGSGAVVRGSSAAIAGLLLGLFPGLLLPAARAQAPTDLRTERAQQALEGRVQGSGLTGTGAAARALDQARRQHQAMRAGQSAGPSASLNAVWSSIGPGQVASASFGNLTGRVTAIVVDPADATGNTVYVGTTGGGLWKSVNAAGPAASVTFQPLTDTLSVFNAGAGSSATASLSIGSLALSAAGVLLAGTGDPNDATDSYYGAGLLRSADGGVTWTLIQESHDGVAGNHSFFGLSVAALAFSSANPAIAVAALADAAEGTAVNAPDQTYSVPGLYTSADAGVTWQMATIEDGSQIVQGPGFAANGATPDATAVVWDGRRGLFIAAVRAHGYYQSTDGMTWTRLAHQPAASLTATACPANPGSASCPIYRGALAVQTASGDLFALTVDANNLDQGLSRDACAASGTQCASGTILFASALNAAPLEVGGGNKTILQGDYDLALAAVPSGADTLLFVGTIDLYRCSLAAGCALRNTTNAQNGCAHPAGVFPAQHALAGLTGAGAGGNPLLYLGNDGGMYRSTDGVAELQPACSADDATHFQNLNSGLGSLAEIVSFAEDPVATGTLLAGLGALGSAGTATPRQPWAQLATGEGGLVAIDQTTPSNWFLSNGPGVSVNACSQGASCTSNEFVATIGPAQVAGDAVLVHAAWLLDAADPANLLLGTCRAWRGPAANAAVWSSANNLSRPFGASAATACGGSFPLVRSLAGGGPAAATTSAANSGSEVLYAGLEGAYATGLQTGGHLFTTAAANLASNTTVWRDAAIGTVTNDSLDNGVFNPGRFDVSSVAVDPHDQTGKTIYATILGFAANGVNSPHVYGSTDAGAHWLNLSANLPNAPANSVLVDPNDANTLYVGMDTGVYVTTQVTTCPSANCWSIYGTSLPNAPVISLEASAAMATGDGRLGELRAGTYGRGIWTIPLLNALTPAAPAITLNPATLTFAVTAVGNASAAQTITVTDSGNAALTISSVAVSGDFTESDTCARSTVQQGASCTVSVTFVPAATGSRSGVLTVYGNVAGGQATASLNGPGSAPAAIVLTPTSLSFPQTNVGATSAVMNITVSNTGGQPATIQLPAIAGDFRIAADSCVAGTLAAGTGCTVSLVFAPAAAGTRTGTLTVVSSAGTEVATLIGNGVAPATDTLAPASLLFAAQQVGTASAAQQVTLTNAGDSALTLITAQTSGDFAVANACGNSLAGHSTCAFSVTYTPHTAGAESGVLTVTDAIRTQTVALSGSGLAPPGVSLLPSTGLTFAATAVGSSAVAQNVTLTNNGGVPLTLSGITVSGDFFVQASGNSCGSSLAPAAQCSFAVGFTPGAAGSRAGTVSVTDNAANSPQTLPLSGIGVDFTLSPDGPATATLSSGQTASYLLLLSANAAVPGSAVLTCSGLPANALCSVSPPTPALAGSTVVTVTVTTGTKAAAEAPVRPGSWPISVPVFAGLGWGVGLCLRRRKTSAGGWMSVAVLLMLVSLGGCSVTRTIPDTGGTTASPVLLTPSGTYTLIVAASSDGLVRAANLTLVVH
jgi:hypothetical protein